jgi:Ca2+-binding RTX toxin-like protein
MDPADFSRQDNARNLVGVGDDFVYGSADDVKVLFSSDGIYDPTSYRGPSINDSLNTVAYGLSTGTKAGTYFDFVTGTLYVTGTIDDGRKDTLEVKSAGSNLKVYINGELALTRPAAGVTRVVLNGSSDQDTLNASQFTGPVTLQGKAGRDQLTGGASDDLLLGGADNDELWGNAGADILVGGDGDDFLDGGPGIDLLIGGLGADDLHAGAGGDLLIGARTAFDANATALSAILAEWSSARSYETRIANLRGPGSNSRANGNYFLKTSGAQATVFEDSATDALTGGSGRDWFVAQLSGKRKDKLNGVSNNEQIDALPPG